MLPGIITEPGSSSSGDSPSPSLTPSDPEQPPEQPADQSKRALTRRGHFKSRLGCFNCKRRRIKCSEIRPECSQCRRLALECVYPAVTSSVTTSTAPRASLSVINIEDLRLYHRFITSGLPTLPLKGDELWLQAAAMSHTNECLAHAILGLGASHISQTEEKYAVQALRHRTITIRLFNEQLSRVPETPAAADALFATIGCLLTQAALLPNNMLEYVTLTRIADFVVSTVTPRFPTATFHSFTPWRHIEHLVSMVSEQDKDPDLVDGFKKSVTSLDEICSRPTENKFRNRLLHCIDALSISAAKACEEFVILWLSPASLTNEEFFDFLHPKNVVGPILIIHMLLLDYLLGHFCIAPKDRPNTDGRKNTIIGWTRSLAQSLPSGCQQYIEWPLAYCEILSKQDARYLLNP